MTYMISELDGVAFDLPGAAFRRSKLVLGGIVALLKAASKSSCFLVGGFCCVLCSGQCGSTRKHEQRKQRHRDFDFHSLPPKFRFENWKRRPGNSALFLRFHKVPKTHLTIGGWFSND